MKRLTLTIFVAMLVSAIVFSVRPEIDLAVSATFYKAASGFVGERDPVIQAIYKGVPLMSMALAMGLFIALFAYTFERGAMGRRRRVQMGYLIASLALGPGLLVSGVLKDFTGRPPPAKITRFGGTQSFSPVLVRSDECKRNCATVSEHATAGFFLASLGFLGGSAARRRWTLIGLATGGFLGFARITQGGHYLSDILLSFFVTWFAAWAVWLVFRYFGLSASEESLVSDDSEC